MNYFDDKLIQATFNYRRPLRQLLVLEDCDILSIRYAGFALNPNGEYAYDCPIPQGFIRDMRLRAGVYETFSCTLPRENARWFCCPIDKFSISLN